MWQGQFPDFLESCKLGQQAANLRVERSFYERAVGYDSEKVFQFEGGIIRAPIREHVPPDPRAAEFRLRNREPGRWKDAKQVEGRAADDDPLLAYLRSINGRVMRPQQQPKMTDVTGSDVRVTGNDVTRSDVTTVTQQEQPSRPIGGSVTMGIGRS
jgi:hypothetical protein